MELIKLSSLIRLEINFLSNIENLFGQKIEII